MTAPIDLAAISAEFLTQCGSCDAGVSVICTCVGRDYRPTMLALVREVERLRGRTDAFAERLSQVSVKVDWERASQMGLTYNAGWADALEWVVAELKGEGQ